MDSKKLVKVIKALVEAEVSKKQEVFLKKTFPKILDEAVKARMKTITSNKTEEVDPFSLANAVLEEDRKESQPVVENQTYTKNPMLNQVLNETLQSGVTDTMDKTCYIWNTQRSSCWWRNTCRTKWYPIFQRGDGSEDGITTNGTTISTTTTIV